MRDVVAALAGLGVLFAFVVMYGFVIGALGYNSMALVVLAAALGVMIGRTSQELNRRFNDDTRGSGREGTS